MLQHVRAALVMTAALVLTVAAPAYAAGHGHTVSGGGGGGGGGTSSPSGFDISYPQCNGTFPAGALFGVVGVNGGIVYKANPCLGTTDGPSELAWAVATGAPPQFYANTADPGPYYSSHWDVSGWANYPQDCSASATNSAGCSYDYGWYAAADSFNDAVTAEFQLDPTADASAAAAAATWWLDVETGNSWESLESYYSGDLPTAYANDTAALHGAADYLAGKGVAKVGFYSTGYQWGQITGGAQFPTTNPDWVAGFSSATSAATGCTLGNSFTSGPVALTQYQTKGYDADHAC